MCDLALTNMALGDKAAAFALAEQAMAAVPIEKDAMDGPYSNRDPRSCGSANGRARPRHRCFTETSIDTCIKAPSLSSRRSLPPCFGSIRCSIRFAVRSAFPKTLRGKAEINSHHGLHG